MDLQPFHDRGLLGLSMMNVELSIAGLSKILIPPFLYPSYITGLGQLTREGKPDAIVGTMLECWQFSSNIMGADLNAMEAYLVRCNAFKTHAEVRLKKIITLEIEQGWSDPRLVEYGKSIYLYPCSDNVSVKIFNASGEFAMMSARAGEAMEIKANIIAPIFPQQIIFKAASPHAHIEYELL
jgi:hypothetical protein